jgi:hypothetical protein
MAGIEGSCENDQCRQGQETEPGRERFIKIMRMKALGSSIDKAPLHVLYRIVWGIMRIGMPVVIIDMAEVRMIVAMVMRVAMPMTMRGSMVHMRSMCLMG